MSEEMQMDSPENAIDFAAEFERIENAIGVMTGLASVMVDTNPDDGTMLASKAIRTAEALQKISDNYWLLQSIDEDESNTDEAMFRLTDEQASWVTEATPLVKHVVMQVAVNFPRHVDRQELQSAGNMGLIEAAMRFDEARGVPFERYAARRIKGAILDYARKAARAPRSVRSTMKLIEQAESELAKRHDQPITDRDIAAKLELATVQVQEARRKHHESVVLSLDATVSDDEDENMTLGEVLESRDSIDPADVLEDRELIALLRDAVQLLPDVKRRVIEMYFIEGHESQRIASELGVTESRVSQIRTETLEFLLHALQAQFDTDSAGDDATPNSLTARRRKLFAEKVGQQTDWKSRI